jgi:GntR family transcriptional regulator
MSVDHEGDEYVYVQLASILRERIRSGDLPPGRALPSARLLSQQYEVAIGTVKKAIELLRAEGLVRTVIGRGIFVSRPDGQLRPAAHGSCRALGGRAPVRPAPARGRPCAPVFGLMASLGDQLLRGRQLLAGSSIPIRRGWWTCWTSCR